MAPAIIESCHTGHRIRIDIDVKARVLTVDGVQLGIVGTRDGYIVPSIVQLADQLVLKT